MWNFVAGAVIGAVVYTKYGNQILDYVNKKIDIVKKKAEEVKKTSKKN